LRRSILAWSKGSGSAMVYYRFYQINQRGKVFTAPTILKCRDDDEALAQGRDLVGEFMVEIWDGGRRVGALGPKRVGFEQ
jgi:hypothetical protein